jgi:formate--tetrahydrofolate ligase
LGDYAVTEAGFGSDLGAEKFFNIKCRAAELKPDCAVLVATVRALAPLSKENIPQFANLGTHIENIAKFGVPVVVAINRFPNDTQEELDAIKNYCEKSGVKAICSEVFAKGGEGGLELAQAVADICDSTVSDYAPLYALDLPIRAKLETIAREIYRAEAVDFTKTAQKAMEEIEKLGFADLPVCVAKTQYSLSDDPAKLGGAEQMAGHRITVRDLRLSAGAGFIVALTGDIMTLPGLPKVPSANNIDIDKNGNIDGLF